MARMKDSRRHLSDFPVVDPDTDRLLAEIWRHQHADVKRLSMLCNCAVKRATALREPREMLWAWLSRALLDGSQSVAAARRDLADAIPLLQQVRDARAARLADVCDAMLHLRAGDIQAAAQAFHRLPLIGMPGRDDSDDYFVLLGRGTCAAALGQVELAVEVLSSALHLAQRTGPVVRRWEATIELAEVLCSLDKSAQAVTVLRQLMVASSDAVADNPCMQAHARMVLALARLDEGPCTEAVAVLEDLQACPSGDGWALPAAWQARVCRGLAAAIQGVGGSADSARRYLLAAQAQAQSSGSSLQVALCLVDAAKAEVDDEARRADLLERALANFDAAGDLAGAQKEYAEAVNLLTDCHAQAGRFEQAYACHRRYFELHRQRLAFLTRGQVALSRVPETDGNAVAISDREVDVLRWCAAGKTAWETGQILHLSEWTVVYHLERVKRKFGLNRKQQVVARAVSLGLIPAGLQAARA